MTRHTIQEAEIGNTVLSEIMLKYLITEFPESDYKRSSASYLLSIQEDDFQSLKTYFINEPNLHSDDLIELYTGYLQTYCEIQSENYQEAIDWLESIITNPPSIVDSVYAVIDLGDLYLQMEGNGRGAIGRYTNLIPRSREEFEETRENLFALLSKKYHYANPMLHRNSEEQLFYVENLIKGKIREELEKKYKIEEITTKKGIPVDALIIKEAFKEAITPLNTRIAKAVDAAVEKVKESIRKYTKKGDTVIVGGIGNTIGIGQTSDQIPKKFPRPSKEEGLESDRFLFQPG